MTDEHFPWSYTQLGVICACGSAMRPDETCMSYAPEEGCTCGHPASGHLVDGLCRLCGCTRYTPGQSES